MVSPMGWPLPVMGVSCCVQWDKNTDLGDGRGKQAPGMHLRTSH